MGLTLLKMSDILYAIAKGNWLDAYAGSTQSMRTKTVLGGGTAGSSV